MYKAYLSVTKPGIIFGNSVALLGGFFLGAKIHGSIEILVLFSVLLGLSFVIASGCVFNNYIDRDIDVLMERTKKRVSVRGEIPCNVAMIYASSLGLVGFLILYIGTNLLTDLIALIGFFFYVIVYSLWFKRNSVHGTLIGGISGSVPPVIGYCAATNTFDAAAIILFSILFFWQLPHFYAISIYRIKDYKAASIPVLPATKGIKYTKYAMFIYVLGFSIAALMPYFFGFSSIIYGGAAFIMSLYWLYYAAIGLVCDNKPGFKDKQWARKMFIISIFILLITCALWFF